MSEVKRVLIIEDRDTKWRDVHRALTALDNDIEFTRAATVEQANAEIARGIWSLVILDVSMDIRASSAGRGAGGHDTIGGLKIAERMFYLQYDAPIIIVTAFDAFPSTRGKKGAVLGLQDVIAEATRLLGSLLAGWVRYGDPDWDTNLSNLASEVLAA